MAGAVGVFASEALEVEVGVLGAEETVVADKHVVRGGGVRSAFVVDPAGRGPAGRVGLGPGAVGDAVRRREQPTPHHRRRIRECSGSEIVSVLGGLITQRWGGRMAL